MKVRWFKTAAVLGAIFTGGIAAGQNGPVMELVMRAAKEGVGLVDGSPRSQLAVFEERLKVSLRSFNDAKADVDRQLSSTEKQAEMREQELLQIEMLLARFKEEYGLGTTQGFPRTVLNRTYTQVQLKTQVESLLARRAELQRTDHDARERLIKAHQELEQRLATTKQHLENMPVYVALAQAGNVVGKSEGVLVGLDACVRENELFLARTPIRNADELRRELQQSTVVRPNVDEFLKDAQVASPPQVVDETVTVAELTAELRRFVEERRASE